MIACACSVLRRCWLTRLLVQVFAQESDYHELGLDKGTGRPNPDCSGASMSPRHRDHLLPIASIITSASSQMMKIQNWAL